MFNKKDNKQIPNSYMYTNESNGDTIGSPFKPIKNMIPQGQNYRGAFNFSNYETNNGKEVKIFIDHLGKSSKI